jgi:general secretion pathway protein C
MPSRERLEKVGLVARWVALLLGVSYLLAVVVSSWLVSGMTSTALAALGRMTARTAAASLTTTASAISHRDIEKAVKERNIFNSSGEFPNEADPDAKGEEVKASNFDINAPCVKPTVQVDLVGTIYLDGGNSLATLMEQGYSEADIYREGDAIVGNEQAIVARIERNRVILNNNGVKECIELAATDKKTAGSGFPDVQPSTGSPEGGGPVDAPPVAGGSSDCVLEEKYVQDELGPGFGTIIQKARLVPNTVDNQMNGFKIFAIDQGSLLGKAGLQNGDIITQVNDTSLKQPEQGFTLYQAFQDEREVRVHILRRGTTPMMITCRIK